MEDADINTFRMHRISALVAETIFCLPIMAMHPRIPFLPRGLPKLPQVVLPALDPVAKLGCYQRRLGATGTKSEESKQTQRAQRKSDSHLGLTRSPLRALQATRIEK